jgi:hypothetical protein
VNDGIYTNDADAGPARGSWLAIKNIPGPASGGAYSYKNITIFQLYCTVPKQVNFFFGTQLLFTQSMPISININYDFTLNFAPAVHTPAADEFWLLYRKKTGQLAVLAVEVYDESMTNIATPAQGASAFLSTTLNANYAATNAIDGGLTTLHAHTNNAPSLPR